MDSLSVTAENTYERLLVVRPRPLPGEATVGYLMRVAEANGYGSARQLWQAVKSPRNLYQALQLSEQEMAYLQGFFPGYWRHDCGDTLFAVSDFNHANLSWCPLCLMESGHPRPLVIEALSGVYPPSDYFAREVPKLRKPSES